MELFECNYSLFLPRYGEADNRVFIHKGSVWTKSNDNVSNDVELERDNKRIVLSKKVFELYFRRTGNE